MFPDLLILDEVDVRFGSATERLMLFDILNEPDRSFRLLSRVDLTKRRITNKSSLMDRSYGEPYTSRTNPLKHSLTRTNQPGCCEKWITARFVDHCG